MKLFCKLNVVGILPSLFKMHSVNLEQQILYSGSLFEKLLVDIFVALSSGTDDSCRLSFYCVPDIVLSV